MPETFDNGLDTFSSIINSVPSIDESSSFLRDMSTMRDDFFNRIPEQAKLESIRSVWQDLWENARRSLTPEQMNMLGEAFVFAAQAHQHQFRKSGDPYIIHTINAALILAKMNMDLATLQAALLHDTLEDTDTSPEQLREKFGDDVETLVDGVTKLAQKKDVMSRDDITSENLRKMFLVMARDVRVVLIKLADRLHNMRTLNVMKPEKQQRIALETMEIYAPLAHRLGIYNMKSELEDLSFMYLKPGVYNEIVRRVKERLPKMEEVITEAKTLLEERLQKENIPCRIKGRAKHYFSIYEKMQRKKISFEELYDILAVRILVQDVTTCYSVLGIVHALWTPIPGQFDDYIANPKINLYQSLHTTVMVSGVPLEVQIRTYEMNHFAEYGIAAHWLYKEGGGKKGPKGIDAKLMWVRQMLEAGEEGGSSAFLEVVKEEVMSDDVYVFTPDGKPMILASGSTTLDFAYAVHTEVGNHCAGAMINGRIVPLDTQLHNGDMVRIITSKSGTPSRDWLKMTTSAKTRNKIKAWFKRAEKVHREEAIERGWKLIERELRRRNLGNVSREELGDIDELLLSVGSKGSSPAEAAQQLSLTYLQHHSPSSQLPPDSEPQPAPRRRDEKSDILVDGEGGVSVALAGCCSPVPGDDIIGCTSERRGIVIHRADCKAAQSIKPGRLVNVEWAVHNDDEGNPNRKGGLYSVKLRVEGVERDELVADVKRALTLDGGSYTSIKSSMIGNSLVLIRIELRVRNLSHLYSLMGRINEVRGILEVVRGG